MAKCSIYKFDKIFMSFGDKIIFGDFIESYKDYL